MVLDTHYTHLKKFTTSKQQYQFTSSDLRCCEKQGLYNHWEKISISQANYFDYTNKTVKGGNRTFEATKRS